MVIDLVKDTAAHICVGLPDFLEHFVPHGDHDRHEVVKVVPPEVDLFVFSQRLIEHGLQHALVQLEFFGLRDVRTLPRKLMFPELSVSFYNYVTLLA